ncbi:MAG: hypothetical protein K2G87_06680 [Oscillospiraceae bacterium]|nr:hypothetical protein [Oscillospiraceae bacterium]
MERPCTIRNGLQDMELTAPSGTPLHDKECLAGYGADHTAWNVLAR